MKRLIFSCLVFLSALIAFGQPATPAQMAGVKPDKNYGTVHLESKLGSFKLRDGVGKVTVSFSGTLLISRLKGTVSLAGKLKKEYEGKDRQVYHGTGTATITGTFRGIQWFGTDMKCVWYGFGLVQVSGEFDSNLDTGFVWYDEPKHKRPWFVGGITTLTVSANEMENRVKPVERGKSTGGG